ncbi:type VI secretion system Vgr family protein [Hymenobacter weizhouensis]|uniref:type VI secretion system Vgr family protein n=1 Tax=Hymenobacter sp. YIM 151500-1 TaxID=2987689 RepID=UPI002226173B|nr:type VI secretion system tip protein VgrG [Hymenobacter sp. YIM 151500-1]UYZ64376.1 type VI secretion system tip protein VgrG [Hymenobacter sp. YIM 151500-1]
MEKAHQQLVGKPIYISIQEDSLTETDYTFRFTGVVTSLLMSSSNNYTGSFIIKGFSPTCLLTDGVQKRTFRDKTLADIVKQVLQPYHYDSLKLAKGTLAHTAPLPYVAQYNESNFDFLNRLLTSYQEWFYFNGTELCIGQEPGEKTTSLFMDGYWSTFQVEAAIQPSAVTFYAYDATRHQHFHGPGPDTSGEVASNPYAKFAVQKSRDVFTQPSHLPALAAIKSSSELDQLAKTISQAGAASALLFRGRTDNPNLRLGQLLDATAEGLGSTVTRKDSLGKYRIISLSHEVDEEGNYQNTFKAVPHSLPVPPLNPHAVLPAAQPELAEVIDLKDPQKLGRLRVRYHWTPARPQDAESGWLRVTTPYSGDGKGQLFTPEIGSQVLIGYEHNHPETPIVLGNLFHANNKQKASYSPDDNAVKGIQTASGNKITFHDKKGKEKILISSGQKKDTKLEVSFAKDGSIVLKTKGMITLDAGEKIILESQDIVIAAQDTLELQGRTISIQAETKLEATGQKVEVTAQTTLDLAGQTGVKVEGLTAEVSGSTMTTIKGTLVKIN